MNRRGATGAVADHRGRSRSRRLCVSLLLCSLRQKRSVSCRSPASPPPPASPAPLSLCWNPSRSVAVEQSASGNESNTQSPALQCRGFGRSIGERSLLPGDPLRFSASLLFAAKRSASRRRPARVKHDSSRRSHRDRRLRSVFVKSSRRHHSEAGRFGRSPRSPPGPPGPPRRPRSPRSPPGPPGRPPRMPP